MINVREKWPSNRQRSMVIFRKDHVLEAGVNGIVQVKNLPIFFFNFEKLHGAQSQIHKIIVNDTKSQNTIKYKIK